MRSTAVPILLAAALAGCGDKPARPPEQANIIENAPVAQNMVSAVTPDEAPPSAPVPVAGRIDRSHAGQPAPALGFVDPAGKPVTLASYRGTPVLLNLWATWCGPCVKELPTLDALAVRDAGKLTVVTLSQDLDAAKATAFMNARKFKMLKAWTDPKMAWVPAVASNLPTSILINAAGKEVWRTTGDLDWTGKEATDAIAAIG